MTDGPRRERLAWIATWAGAVLAVLAFHWRAAAPGMAFAGWDLRYFFYAVREATAEALRAGTLPHWQRGMFLGYPLLADPQAAVLDPATWLTLPWEAPRALTLATLFHLSVAAGGMVAWMRMRGRRPAAALLAAVLFALGAKQTVHLQHWTFAASTAWWPWMLVGIDGFAAAGRGRWLLLTSAAAGLSWLGGAPQMAYFGTLVAGAYAAVLAPGLWRRRRLDAVLVLAAAPAGVLLASPIVLPALELARLGPRGAGVAYEFVTSWKWPDRWALSLLLLPRAYTGSPAWGEMNLWEATGYLGILPLALALRAPLRDRRVWPFLALAVIGIWLGFGEDAWLGLHRLLYRVLPGYASFRNPTRSLMVTSFASAVLAAEGLDALRAAGAPLRRSAAPIAALVLVACVTPLLPRAASFPLDRWAAAAGAATAVGVALLGVAWLLAGRWLARARAGGTAWALAAVALAGGDLYRAFGTMNDVAPAAWQVPALADVAPLVPAAPAPRRVGVLTSWGATSNAPLRRGWEGAAGYGPTMIQRVRTLLEATRTDEVRAPAPIVADIDFPRPSPTSPLWALLATPLVVSDEPLALPVARAIHAEYEEAWRENGSAAYAAAALPRVFWTAAWEKVPDDAVTGPLLRAARGELAVVAPESDTEAWPVPRRDAATVAASRVEALGPTVSASVEAPAAGVLVVLEPWFPGWRATVDGRPVAIARADYAFMAVPVPAGRHELRLVYRNERVGRGFAVAGLTIAAVVGVVAARRRRPGR